MTRLFLAIAVALICGCSQREKEVSLPACWDSKTVSLPVHTTVVVQNALIFYSPDGPLSLHPNNCDGAPLWLRVKPEVFKLMEQDQSKREWNGGEFFRAELVGEVTPDSTAPGGLVITVSQLTSLSRAVIPDRLR